MHTGFDDRGVHVCYDPLGWLNEAILIALPEDTYLTATFSHDPSA